MGRLQIQQSTINKSLSDQLRRLKLTARTNGDRGQSLIAAAYAAKKHNVTYYVYLGNSYMSAVWNLATKPSDYLDPINNMGDIIYSVTPDLVVTEHKIKREKNKTARRVTPRRSPRKDSVARISTSYLQVENTAQARKLTHQHLVAIQRTAGTVHGASSIPLIGDIVTDVTVTSAEYCVVSFKSGKSLQIYINGASDLSNPEALDIARAMSDIRAHVSLSTLEMERELADQLFPGMAKARQVEKARSDQAFLQKVTEEETPEEDALRKEEWRLGEQHDYALTLKLWDSFQKSWAERRKEQLERDSWD
jgi:hypothetical protein